MKTSPLFSIIIPLYKKPDTIVETLQSCLEQEYKDFEVIVVDDGSPDDSLERAKSVTDSRIRIISQKNAGVSAARNKGIEEAQGEWILCLDADDCLLHTALKHFSEAIFHSPTYNAFVADTWWSYQTKPNIPTRIEKVYTFGYLQYAIGRFFPNAGCTIVRRDLLLRLKYDTRMSFYEDQDLYLRIMQYTKFGYINVATYMHRAESTGLSSGHHNINREAAYYFNEREFKSLSQQLAYLRILDFCQWSRYVEGDIDGINYYENLSKQKFSLLCRAINNLHKRWINLKRRLYIR